MAKHPSNQTGNLGSKASTGNVNDLGGKASVGNTATSAAKQPPETRPQRQSIRRKHLGGKTSAGNPSVAKHPPETTTSTATTNTS
jgi:hypothetical protein